MPAMENLRYFFNWYFALINWNNKWWRWSKSGLSGLKFLENNLLKIENKFSKAGYHKNNTIKYGETFWFKWKWIKINPIINDNKYEPPSPKYDLLKKLKKIKLNKVGYRTYTISILSTSTLVFKNSKIVNIAK